MSLENIDLRRLLQLFYLPPSKLQSELRKDIRMEVKKRNGEDGGQGFYTAFWADAKNHVARKSNLRERTAARIAANPRTRSRLYPLLTNGFLQWWDEKRRWRNEEFNFLSSVSAHYDFEQLGTVKVENLIALHVGDEFDRLVYPYFNETPVLSEEGARIGLWVMHEALPNYQIEDLRILDIHRGKSFGTIDVPFKGNEEGIFTSNYSRVLRDWKKLWEDY